LTRPDRRRVAAALAVSLLAHAAIFALIVPPAAPPMQEGTRFTVLLIPVPGEQRAESDRSATPSLAAPPAPEGTKPAVRPRRAQEAGAPAPATNRRRPWVSAGPSIAPVLAPQSQLADAADYVPAEGLGAFPQFVVPFEMPYPLRAFEEGRRAVVVVQVMIDEKGRVTEAMAASDAPPDFAAAAVAGLRAARFTPARAGGGPVKARAYFAVSFVIE
jgi:TonB family protein